MLSLPEVVTHAEQSLGDPMTYVVTAVVGLLVFVFKGAMKGQSISRDEMTKMQIHIGVLEEKIKRAETDIDGIGKSMREIKE